MREFTAYEKYLVGNPTRSAAKHLFDCVMKGGPENQAWELIERYKGKNWRCAPDAMGQLMVDVILALKAEYTGQTELQSIPRALAEELLNFVTEKKMQGDQDAEKLLIKLMLGLGMINPKGLKT